jgi:hypothetical protein
MNRNSIKETKKITISAMLVALGVVIMVLGAVIETLDLTVGAIASLIVVFVFIEIGKPYHFLVWLCTTLITALLFPGSALWVEYFLIFGIYPILKAYIERLPTWSWWPVKILYINAVVAALAFGMEKLLGIPFFEEVGGWMIAAFWALLNVAFVMYDIFLRTLIRVYMVKYRERFSKLLR